MIWPRIIGQDRVKHLLLSAMRKGKLPHAYLFVGNDGVGKDAVALELARVLHCEKGGEEACNECPSCVKVDSMQHPDVKLVVALPVGKGEKADDQPLEKLSPDEIRLVQEQFKLKAENPYCRITIPKATIIKINSIRDIRRESALSTYSRRKRVILISRADEMGDAAANTLLKTLEEPGGNTMLILTTSHRGALASTIISRCQVVQFDPLTETDICAALVDRNGVERGQASLVARLAHGSYSKALELLQDDVTVQRQQVVAFVRAALGSSVVAITDVVEELCATKDRDVLVRFLNLVLMWFRDALVLAQGGQVINLDQQDDIKRFVSRFSQADLIKTLADVERAIFLVERNVYINLVMLHLAVQLRSNILPYMISRQAEAAQS
ncbi:MAG TPA: DNA polymerase III subunit delta' [Bacteroidetes bacterium]|jgi:DNA polymerase III subunit delta'|nr:DNA polymerase III subunit delta' [Bacteroidota bacterium]